MGYWLYDRAVYEIWYTQNYTSFLSHPELMLTSSQQIGWSVYNCILLLFSRDTDWFFFATSSLYVLTALFLLRETDASFPVLVAFLFATPAILYSTYLCRQMIACALVNVALLCCLRNRAWLGSALSLVAVSVHAAALVMVPFVVGFRLLTDSRSGHFVCTLVMVVGCVLALFAVPFMGWLESFNIVSAGISSFEGVSGILVTVGKGLPFYALLVYVLFERRELEKESNRMGFCITQLLLACLSWLLTPLNYWMFRIAGFALPSVAWLAVSIGHMRGGSFRSYIPVVSGVLLFVLTLREIAIAFH